jgi:hypothetical protein
MVGLSYGLDVRINIDLTMHFGYTQSGVLSKFFLALDSLNSTAHGHLNTQITKLKLTGWKPLV